MLADEVVVQGVRVRQQIDPMRAREHLEQGGGAPVQREVVAPQLAELPVVAAYS